MMKKRSMQHKILEDLKHHLLEYMLLLVSAGIFLVFLALFKGQPIKQFTVTTIFVLYYVVWGLVHHTRDQSLHLKVVLEYVAIGGLALLVLKLLLT